MRGENSVSITWRQYVIFTGVVPTFFQKIISNRLRLCMMSYRKLEKNEYKRQQLYA